MLSAVEAMKVFRASYTMELQDLFFLIRPVVITGKYTHTQSILYVHTREGDYI